MQKWLKKKKKNPQIEGLKEEEGKKMHVKKKKIKLKDSLSFWTHRNHNTAVMQGNRPISVQNWPTHLLTFPSSANIALQKWFLIAFER